MFGPGGMFGPGALGGWTPAVRDRRDLRIKVRPLLGAFRRYVGEFECRYAVALACWRAGVPWCWRAVVLVCDCAGVPAYRRDGAPACGRVVVRYRAVYVGARWCGRCVA
jgi:hypothetical protein